MPFEIGRVISILIALVGLAIAYWFLSAGVFHLTVIVIVLPLGCIWYGNEIGSFAETTQDGEFNPLGLLITFTGWAILAVLLAILVWMAIRS